MNTDRDHFVQVDKMVSSELAANLFRATQVEAGEKVRQTIDELGGTMPEDLPVPEEDLKRLERRAKLVGKKRDNCKEFKKKQRGG